MRVYNYIMDYWSAIDHRNGTAYLLPIKTTKVGKSEKQNEKKSMKSCQSFANVERYLSNVMFMFK